GVGGLEIEIVDQVLGRRHFLLVGDFENFIFERIVGGIVFNFGYVAVRIRVGIIGQDERVLAVFVFEEVEDAFLFHQSRNEVERRLPILNAIVASCVRRRRRVLVVREAKFVEQSGDDIDGTLTLVDAAVEIG